MKIDNTNLMQRARNFILFPALSLAILFLYSHTLYPSDSRSILDENQEEVITVVGRILDANSEALDSVIVKDVKSDNETMSDAEGKFTLSLNEPTIVSFAKLGFEVLEIEIAESDSNLVVILIAESNELVVQGFGSDTAGTKDNKWMLDSLSAITDNPPLYIIDDRQEESDFSITTIDPDDVVTVEVLSDSIAEALYGSDGERGAVRITTNSSSNITERQTPPMQLNNNDTAATILRDKYKMYLDTMNARNARLRERNNKGLKRNAQLPTKNDHSIDSLNSLNEKGLDEKMNSPLDTTLIESKNDTTTLKMQVDTTYIENKRDTINSVNDIK